MTGPRGAAIAMLVTGLGMLGGAGSASARWTIQSTQSSDGDVMTGVSCVESSCMGVLGTSGVAGSELWNGRTWSIRPVPNPARGAGRADNFAGVSCTSANACTAVGNYGHVSQELPLVERWNGRRWSVQPTRTRFLGRGGFGTLNAVSCPSARFCMAAGDRGNSSRHTFLVAEGWNGSHWTPVPVPERAPVRGASAFFTGVSCSSPSACIAVGGYGHLSHQLPLIERWNGRSWSMEHASSTVHGTSILNAVSCPSARACLAVGYHGHEALIERWNGRRWSVQPAPHPGGGNDALGGVSCSSGRACTAVGSSDTGERVLAERWNGRTWSIQAPPNQGSAGDSFDGVSCPSQGSCTAVGSDNMETTCNSVMCPVPEPMAERWTG